MAALILAGCSATRPPQIADETLPAESISKIFQDETFDPLSLDDEDVIVLPRSQLKAAPSESTVAGTRTESEGKVREVPGYRVQIFVSRDEFETRQMEEQALMSFEDSVYLIFDSPNYKIRVGDCLTRAEANELRQRAVARGYRDAWVVQCKVVTVIR
jgi:hypothetical protein